MLYELHVLQRVWKVRKTFCNKKALPDISWARLKLHMVTPGGFEPSIFDLGGRCIILLCYGAISYNKLLYTKKALLAITKQYITARADAQLKNNYKRSANPGGMLHSTRTPV